MLASMPCIIFIEIRTCQQTLIAPLRWPEVGQSDKRRGTEKPQVFPGFFTLLVFFNGEGGIRVAGNQARVCHIRTGVKRKPERNLNGRQFREHVVLHANQPIVEAADLEDGDEGI